MCQVKYCESVQTGFSSNYNFDNIIKTGLYIINLLEFINEHFGNGVDFCKLKVQIQNKNQFVNN